MADKRRASYTDEHRRIGALIDKVQADVARREKIAKADQEAIAKAAAEARAAMRRAR
jgi:hypothetical protein